MIGFPDVRRYAILKQRDDSVFMWLHAVDDGTLAFPIVLVAMAVVPLMTATLFVVVAGQFVYVRLIPRLLPAPS